MHQRLFHFRSVMLLAAGLSAPWASIAALRAADAPPASATAGASERRLLYVAEPGIRNYLEYGGHGVLVFDIDQGHRFVRRISTRGLDEQGVPLNVKGVCASA